MAQTLHGSAPSVFRLGLLMLALAAGCVIPPSLSVDNQDGGTNSPPAILSVSSDDQVLPEPGPVNFIYGGGIAAGSMSITMIDTDVNDTLYVSLFVDWTISDPKSPRQTCMVGTTGSRERTATCSLNGVCEKDDVGRTNLFLTVQVFDRPVSENEIPQYKTMTDKAGLTTSRSYLMGCQDPS